MDAVRINLGAAQLWRAARWFLAGLGGGLVFLFLFDLVRPAQAPSFGMFVANIGATSGLCAIIALVLFVVSLLLPRLRAKMPAPGWLRKTGLVCGFLFLLPIGLVILEGCVYEPMKFRCLISRVERAQTAAEEKAAFALAARWGSVWEINRIYKSEHLPARVRHLQGAWILELEWLESWPSGSPYRAYRKVIDEQNLQYLWRQKSQKQSARQIHVFHLLT